MKFVVAMWVGFGPLFIFALAFDATKGMFHRWFQYGLGTLFSMAMLSFVSNLVLDLMVRVSAAMWLTKLVNIPGMSAEGISSQAMQQGGLGLVLTMLIISVPPVAAHFFQGQVGSFTHFSAFGGQGQPGPQGQLPGSVVQPRREDAPSTPVNAPNGGPQTMYSHAIRVSGGQTVEQKNQIKSADQVRRD